MVIQWGKEQFFQQAVLGKLESGMYGWTPTLPPTMPKNSKMVQNLNIRVNSTKLLEV